MKRVQMEPEFTLVGGIIRFAKMAEVMRAQLGDDVNVPPEPLVQFTGAIGAAMLARQRQQQRRTEGVRARAG
jgi:activator of 2-hydroxyglutaryl-CoA dehydratase